MCFPQHMTAAATVSTLTIVFVVLGLVIVGLGVLAGLRGTGWVKTAGWLTAIVAGLATVSFGFAMLLGAWINR